MYAEISFTDNIHTELIIQNMRGICYCKGSMLCGFKPININLISSLLYLKKYADKCRNLCTDVFIGFFQDLCGLFLNVTHAFRFVFAVLLPLSSRPPYSPLPTIVSVFVFSHPVFSIPIFPFPGCDYSSACLYLVSSTVI
jgi:hypothetical protein